MNIIKPDTVSIYDELDRQLISCLRENGREASPVLARKLKVSCVTVQRRIKRLVNEGAIRIAVLVDPSRCGSPLGMLFGLKVNYTEVNNVVENLVRQAPVSEVFSTSGRFNVMALAYYPDAEQMAQHLFKAIFPLQGVSHREFLVILHEPDTGKEAITFKFDLFDRALVNLLKKDGRRSVAGMARELDSSIPTVHRHLNQLIKRKQIRVVAYINQRKVEWFRQGAVGFSVQPLSLPKVLATVRSHPAVKFCACTTGIYDIVADIHAESKEHIYEIVEKQLRVIDGINDYDLFIADETKYGPMLSGGLITSGNGTYSVPVPSRYGSNG
jgi:Lrp/AsnC family transcriptional regulator for asnA, asnC and gidA